jgi:ubiquinone/menaquinone biosynthesis C-methylase UbiE
MKLDIGCGNRKKKGYIGIDINKTNDVDIIADAQRLPIKDKSVKKVYAKDILHHSENPEKVMEEIRRVSKSWEIIEANRYNPLMGYYEIKLKHKHFTPEKFEAITGNKCCFLEIYPYPFKLTRFTIFGNVIKFIVHYTFGKIERFKAFMRVEQINS